MDESLKSRFLKKKIQDFASNNCEPFPTILCEMDDIKIVELVRTHCLKVMRYTNNFLPVHYSVATDYTEETLELSYGMTKYGDLLIEVNVNWNW